MVKMLNIKNNEKTSTQYMLRSFTVSTADTSKVQNSILSIWVLIRSREKYLKEKLSNYINFEHLNMQIIAAWLWSRNDRVKHGLLVYKCTSLS